MVSPAALASHAAPSSQASSIHRRPLVLVVDDDERIRTFIAQALIDEGYDVVTAPDGAVALDRACECQPDLILLDLHMPVMDGETFARRYHEEVARRASDTAASTVPAPLVICSAEIAPERSTAAVRSAAILRKPFELDDLYRIVRELISAPASDTPLADGAGPDAAGRPPESGSPASAPQA